MTAGVADLLARLPPGAVRPASAAPVVGSVLPVPAVFRSLLSGGGLRRGSTVEVGQGGPIAVGPGWSGTDRLDFGYAEPVDPGGCTLLLTLIAEVSGAGSWCALVGAPGVGLAAAAEAGVDLARLALVPAPGRAWARVVGALMDGFDLVAVRPPGQRSAADARALTGRARHHGAVLMSLGPWPGADVRLAPTGMVWEGLGRGYGRLRSRRMRVRVAGRGAIAGRPADVEVQLPPVGAPLSAGHPDGGRNACRRRADTA